MASAEKVLTSIAAAVVVGVTLLPAMSAQAGKMATIVRGSGAGSDKAAAFVGHFVDKKMRADDRYELVDIGASLGSKSQQTAERALATAVQAVANGRKSYESLDLEMAEEALLVALDKYERNAGHIKDFKPVADALMLMGAIYILSGERKTGAKRLEQALTIYPDVVPDPQIFNPGMRKIFDAAAKKLAEGPRGDLALESNPGYARVYVDGVFRGVTPLSVEGLTEGRHYVRMVRDGYRPWGKVITISGGMEASETATLTATSGFGNFDLAVEEAMQHVASEDDKPVVDAIDRLGVLLSIDQLMLVDVRLDGEKVAVTAAQYDLNQQRRLKVASQTFSYDSRPDTYEREVNDLIDKHFGKQTLAKKTGDYKAAGDGGLGGVGSGTCFGISCKKARFISLVYVGGGGGVLMAFGGLSWGLAKSNANQYRLTEHRDSQADSYLAASKRWALMGDISFFLGLAAVGAGVTYYFLHDDSPSTDDVVSSGGEGWGFSAVPMPGGASLGLNYRW